MDDEMRVISNSVAICGARTRHGRACRSPAVREKRRCRMHGGAAGSGAPMGNRNALKHGAYTREAIDARARARSLLKSGKKLLAEIGKRGSDAMKG